MTRSRSVDGAEMTGAEVTGAEVSWGRDGLGPKSLGAEMVWGRSVCKSISLLLSHIFRSRKENLQKLTQ